MTARTSKIACSIDSRLLASAEKLRGRTGESRSALISRALESLLAERAHHARVQAYAEGYRDKPETAVEVGRARRQARTALSRVAWDDE